MTSQQGWNVPSDSQSHHQTVQPQSPFSYGFVPEATPPYSAQPPLNSQNLSYNYQTPYSPNAPPITPPPSYPSFYANEYPTPQFFPYNQTQPQFFQPYPPYQHFPSPNLGQQDYNQTNGDTKPSLPYSPTLSENSQSSRNSSIRENVNRASSIGFEETVNSNQTNGLYPTLSNPTPSNPTPPNPTSSNPVSSHDSNANNVSLDKGRTPLPPNVVVLWECAKPAKLYFIQEEGHVVSPNKDVNITAYKCPPMTDVSSYPIGSLAGNARNATVLLDSVDTWRLGLSKERSYIVRGLQGEFAFYDDSTSPARCVMLIFPKGITKEDRQRLDVLLSGSSFIVNEPGNIVDKMESGLGSVLGSFTQTVDNAVKKQTPDLHKSTKWLRKGTGQVVRFGGSIVSKGVHLVSDNVMDKDAPKEATSQHHEIFKALKLYREAVEKKKVTKVHSLK